MGKKTALKKSPKKGRKKNPIVYALRIISQKEFLNLTQF